MASRTIGAAEAIDGLTGIDHQGGDGADQGRAGERIAER